MKTKEENYKKEEWGGWKIVSDMLDRPNEYGIYPTGECYQKLYEFVVSQKQKAIAQTREETLKELIREYQDNELDGKGYDFYFSIRAKIDELNKLKQ